MLAPLVPLSDWPRLVPRWCDPRGRRSGQVCAMARTVYHGEHDHTVPGVVAIVADERTALGVVRGEYGWCWSFESVPTPW